MRGVGISNARSGQNKDMQKTMRLEECFMIGVSLVGKSPEGVVLFQIEKKSKNSFWL